MKALLTASLLALPALAAPALALADGPDDLYHQTCVACHGSDGKGAIPGTPDFTGADSPLRRKDEAALVRSIIDGFQSPGSPMAMPPRGGLPSLSQEQAIALVHYLKERFGPDQ